MIILKNYQRSIKIDAIYLKAFTQKILNFLEYEDFDISIIFVTQQSMESYNTDFKSIRKSTDILSFAFHPHLVAGQRIVAQTDEERCLGDIILCPAYIKQTLKQWNVSFEERLEHLIIHGVCHLLGYDHELDQDYEIMKALENTIAHQCAMHNTSSLSFLQT